LANIEAADKQKNAQSPAGNRWACVEILVNIRWKKLPNKSRITENNKRECFL